jgi:hypothetical protein
VSRNWYEPVTIAELLADLERIGADPATTTICIGTQPLDAGGYIVVRDQGAAVIQYEAEPVEEPAPAKKRKKRV